MTADYTNVNVRLGNGCRRLRTPTRRSELRGGRRAYVLRPRRTSTATGRSTSPRRTMAATTSASSAAAATAPSRRRNTSPLARARLPWRPPTSTATAGSTSPLPTQPGTPCRCCSTTSCGAPTAPPVSISVTDASITEGKFGIKYLTFTVSLSEASAGPVTVRYATQDGTARAWEDYDGQSGTLSFAAGETTKSVRIAIYGDNAGEADESFQLLLSNQTGNAVITDPLGVGLILNDDAPVGRGKKK